MFALTRIQSEAGGPGSQLCRWIRTSQSLVIIIIIIIIIISFRTRRPTGPQPAASLDSTHKTPVSSATVKRLWNASLLGKLPYLRLAYESKGLKWVKGNI